LPVADNNYSDDISLSRENHKIETEGDSDEEMDDTIPEYFEIKPIEIKVTCDKCKPICLKTKEIRRMKWDISVNGDPRKKPHSENENMKLVSTEESSQP